MLGYDYEDYELKIAKIRRHGVRFTITDEKFMIDDLKNTKHKAKSVEEYAKYKLKYLIQNVGKSKAIPLTKDSVKQKLKSVEYFTGTPYYNDGEMQVYVTPELFTLGAMTVPTEKIVVINVERGELWLYVKPPNAPLVMERSLDMNWFDSWKYCRINHELKTVSVKPDYQYFFVSVEKSQIVLAISNGKDGYFHARLSDPEETMDETSTVVTTTVDQNAVCSSSYSPHGKELCICNDFAVRNNENDANRNKPSTRRQNVDSAESPSKRLAALIHKQSYETKQKIMDILLQPQHESRVVPHQLSLQPTEEYVVPNLFAQQPSVQQPPVQQPSVQQPPVQQHPVQQHPVQQHLVHQHPVQQHPVQQHAIQQHPVQQHAIQQHPVQQHAIQPIQQSNISDFLVDFHSELEGNV